MFFFRGRRRRKLLATPLTADQREVMYRAAPLTERLVAGLPDYPGHPGHPGHPDHPDHPPGGISNEVGGLRARHEGIVQVLLHDKHFEGADGLEVTEEMRLCIAGQAALLQLR